MMGCVEEQNKAKAKLSFWLHFAARCICGEAIVVRRRLVEEQSGIESDPANQRL